MRAPKHRPDLAHQPYDRLAMAKPRLPYRLASV